MKRMYALLLALTLLCALLSGCHGQLASEADNAAAQAYPVPARFDESRPFEISFWAKNDTNRTQVAIYEKAIADFQALYPNITVKLRLYTDYGRIYNDVITNIATNTTPNICITYPDHIATYLTGRDNVVPLDSFFADKRYGLGGSELRYDGPTLDELVPQFLSECVLDGSHYALPYMRSTEATYVNRTYVEAMGYELPEVLTWDFIWEVSEAAMEKDADGNFKVNGQSVLIPFIYKSTDNMMIQMLRQKDAGYATESGEVQLFNDTTRALLLTVAEHAKSRAFSTFKISSYPGNFLNAGQCLFAVDSTAGATWMGSQAPNIDIPPEHLVDFETAVYPVPQFDTEHPQMISQGPSVCLFNKADPQEVLASWLFAQYLLTNDVQIAYAETEGYAPVTRKAQQDAAYQDYLSRAGEDNELHYATKIQATELLMANTDHTFTTPVFNGSTSVRDAAGQLIEDVTKAVRRRQSVDEESLTKLFSDVSDLYRLDQIQRVSGVESTAVSDDLGPLPAGSVALLGVIAAVWVLIAIAFLLQRGKTKK